jgi:type II secretory pathway component GspD/PulD (secretin)
MEVSEPTSAFSTSFAGFEVPAFVSRQAETRALLEEGQTLLLGGLYREQTSESEDKVPYLGDIPLLGMLFRKTVFNTSRTELLMAVRPIVAGEASELAVERLPTDRSPLSREEVRTQQNPYGVTRPRIGRRPAPQNDADWPTVQEYLKEKSGRSVD